YYYDDLFRAYSGYSSWNADGRPFANLFYQILTFGQTMPDSFPVALILAIAIFSYVGYLLGKNNGVGSSLVFSIAYSTLIMSPLFISNLLFRYDSSFMVLAVAASVLPYAIDNKSFTNKLLSVAAIIVSLGLYQAAVSLFIAFAGIEFLKISIYKQLSDAFKACALRVLQLLVAYIIYSKIILNLFFIDDYFKSFNKPIGINKSGFDTLLHNINSSLPTIELVFNNGFIIAFSAVFILTSLSLLSHLLKYKKISFLIGVLAAILAVMISVPGIAIFGENPIFYPRVYIGFSALIFFVFVTPIILKKNSRVILGAQLIATFYLFSLMNAATNAVRSDVDFQRVTAERIINNLDTLGASTYHKVVILGQLRNSPLAHINSLSYPVIKVLVPQHFINGYDGGRYTLMHQGLDYVEYPTPSEQSKYRDIISGRKDDFSNNLYSIYLVNGTAVIDFEKTKYDNINSSMLSYNYKNKDINDVYYGSNYFHACVSNSLSPTLKIHEWYYLLFHMKNGEVSNRSFSVPYGVERNNSTCLVSQWNDSIDVNNVESIEFGIYNIDTVIRRLDLGN
ncbi:glucosyltransferase domain-containing protein, partial [Salmonella enterica subsp. enterica serovar Johannesburg]|nr:glucosyltransferase domain-containing protein [Salmonella enterica subsp. enterica serovar Johannesburg]